MITPTSFGQMVIKRHRDTNHLYDENLPYDYHLSLAVLTGNQFNYLLKPTDWFWIEDAIWGHDVLEDTRTSYNDIIMMAQNASLNSSNAKKIAEAIRAVTNYNRGRNRDERMPDYIYQEIRETEGATFVKLCDRIANVKQGLITGSSMRRKYLKENDHFKKMLYTEAYNDMWVYLDKILTLEL